MRGEIRQEPEFRSRQAHRPGPRWPPSRRDVLLQLPSLVNEGAHVRAELEHALRLGEDRAGGPRVAEGEMCARQHEPYLDGHPGNRVVELRSQAVRPCQRCAYVLVSPFVECNACCRRVASALDE